MSPVRRVVVKAAGESAPQARERQRLNVRHHGTTDPSASLAYLAAYFEGLRAGYAPEKIEIRAVEDHPLDH